MYVRSNALSRGIRVIQTDTCARRPLFSVFLFVLYTSSPLPLVGAGSARRLGSLLGEGRAEGRDRAEAVESLALCWRGSRGGG